MRLDSCLFVWIFDQLLYQLVVLIRSNGLSLHLLQTQLHWILVSCFYWSWLPLANRRWLIGLTIGTNWSVRLGNNRLMFVLGFLPSTTQVLVLRNTVVLSCEMWGNCSLVLGWILSRVTICCWLGAFLDKLWLRLFRIVGLQRHCFRTYDHFLVVYQILLDKQLLLWRVLRRWQIWIVLVLRSVLLLHLLLI